MQQQMTSHQAMPLLIEEHLPCAWCLAEQGVAASEGSHGICERHRDIQWKRYLQLKAAKRGDHETARS
jgi:hypothetical protein